MFRVIQFDVFLRFFALVTVGISVGVYALIESKFFPNFSLFKVITIASLVSVFMIFLLMTPTIARKVWWVIGVFKKSIYPDLNGTWEGEIEIENGSPIYVRAVIRQSLLTTEIDLHGETVKSVTLETTPTIEKGQHKLFYVYRATPKSPERPIYNGSTLFDIRNASAAVKEPIELSGVYYTDRKTVGRVSLRKVGNDVNKDVSYY